MVCLMLNINICLITNIYYRYSKLIIDSDINNNKLLMNSKL